MIACESSALTSRTLSGTISNANFSVEGDSRAVNNGMEGTFLISGMGKLVRISSGMGCSFSAMASCKVLDRRCRPSSPRSFACWASRSFSPLDISLDMAALGFPRTTAMGLSKMYSFMSPCQKLESAHFPSASSKKGKISTSACNASISSCAETVAAPLASPARGPYMKFLTIPSIIHEVGRRSDASSRRRRYLRMTVRILATSNDSSSSAATPAWTAITL
mmetsp:Transcript_5221/g.11805  ORF Transcript_5221/g.11805 Transcript_5221/m.11805 type:complete len:221 (+) Transcript_5221:1851-2513(+)